MSLYHRLFICFSLTSSSQSRHFESCFIVLELEWLNTKWKENFSSGPALLCEEFERSLHQASQRWVPHFVILVSKFFHPALTSPGPDWQRQILIHWRAVLRAVSFVIYKDYRLQPIFIQAWSVSLCPHESVSWRIQNLICIFISVY